MTNPVLSDLSVEPKVAAPTPTPEPTATPEPAHEGFMTGGGNVTEGKGKNTERYTHGFETRCDGSQGSFQYSGHAQEGKFRLESTKGVSCSDDPGIEPDPPTASSDPLHMTGTGRWSKTSGAAIEVT